jgi:membrane protein DedA with SNARE-associated domain
VLPAYFGFSGISYKKFIFFDFLGALVWAMSFFFIGYFSGALLRFFVGRRHLKFYALLIILAVAVFYWFGLIVINKLKIKRVAK